MGLSGIRHSLFYVSLRFSDKGSFLIDFRLLVPEEA